MSNFEIKNLFSLIFRLQKDPDIPGRCVLLHLPVWRDGGYTPRTQEYQTTTFRTKIRGDSSVIVPDFTIAVYSSLFNFIFFGLFLTPSHSPSIVFIGTPKAKWNAKE